MHNPAHTPRIDALAALRARYQFLAEALDGRGGFDPQVIMQPTAGDPRMLKPAYVNGPCHLMPYPRESLEKYAARAACATYESHLREACERFAAYLARKTPLRTGADHPLYARIVEDADDCGTALDVFWQYMALQTLARGTMLLVLDMPAQRSDTNLAQSIMGAERAVPYLQAVKPERIAAYTLDARGGFATIGIADNLSAPGQVTPIVRHWDDAGWRITRGADPASQDIIAAGPHPFGACPVLALTESGAPFPAVGRFAQIADLSMRLYNARSELDEILRGQTFSLLTYQLTDRDSIESLSAATARIGTSSMLTYQGQQPGFIAPDSGPAQTYLARITELQTAIDRIGMAPQTESHPNASAESGIARKMRFELLNASLARFARSLQDIENKAWALIAHALGTAGSAPACNWPTDYNLTDSAAELDTLLTMQQTGFPDEVLRAKRAQIVNAEFDGAGPEQLAALIAAVEQPAQERPPAAPGDATPPAAP